MAIVCNEHKILFSLNPRTASTALAECLVENYGGQELLTESFFLNDVFIDKKHVTFDQIIKFKIFDQIDDFKKLTTIRNPFDSTVSSFFNRLKYLPLLDDPEFFANKIKFFDDGEIKVLQKNNFNKWVLFKYGGVKNPKKTQNEKWAKRADVILRFEKIQDDFNVFCEKFSIAKNIIPILNESKRRKDYRFYYNFISRKIISFIFEKDFEDFGYTF